MPLSDLKAEVQFKFLWQKKFLNIIFLCFEDKRISFEILLIRSLLALVLDKSDCAKVQMKA